MNTLELNPMPEVMQEGAGLWGTIAAGVTAGLAILYTLYGKLRTDRTADETETDALKMVRAAVEHWRTLYDETKSQMVRERELREQAEHRASLAINEVEGLRSEVATLRRQIEHLSALVEQYSKGPT